MHRNKSAHRLFAAVRTVCRGRASKLECEPLHKRRKRFGGHLKRKDFWTSVHSLTQIRIGDSVQHMLLALMMRGMSTRCVPYISSTCRGPLPEAGHSRERQHKLRPPQLLPSRRSIPALALRARGLYGWQLAKWPWGSSFGF